MASAIIVALAAVLSAWSFIAGRPVPVPPTAATPTHYVEDSFDTYVAARIASLPVLGEPKAPSVTSMCSARTVADPASRMVAGQAARVSPATDRDPWRAWAGALGALVFPAGLGSGEHFSAGQTTLVIDFANPDPEITNSEIYRIGDTVPSDSEDFAPSGSLFQGFQAFLECVGPGSDLVDQVKKNLAAAVVQTPNQFNMREKLGSMAPDGSASKASEFKTVFVAAYQLEPSFRQKYQEWQA